MTPLSTLTLISWSSTTWCSKDDDKSRNQQLMRLNSWASSTHRTRAGAAGWRAQTTCSSNHFYSLKVQVTVGSDEVIQRSDNFDPFLTENQTITRFTQLGQVNISSIWTSLSGSFSFFNQLAPLFVSWRAVLCTSVRRTCSKKFSSCLWALPCETLPLFCL